MQIDGLENQIRMLRQECANHQSIAEQRLQ